MTAYSGCQPFQTVNVFSFLLTGGMPVPVECEFGRAVSHQFSQCFYINMIFQTSGGKAVTQRMKMQVGNSARLSQFFI